MVDRLQEKKGLVVVDLDGTLIDGNSLHEYIRLGVRHLVAQRRYGAVMRVIAFSALRKMHLISHVSMKWGCYRAIGRDAAMIEKLSERLSHLRRPSVADILTRYSDDGCEVLVATASFDFIAATIPDYAYISTRADDNPHQVECRGTAKAAAVKKRLADNNLALKAVLTDHHDDLPLLMLPADRRYLVAPSTKTRTIVTASNIQFSTL